MNFRFVWLLLLVLPLTVVNIAKAVILDDDDNPSVKTVVKSKSQQKTSQETEQKLNRGQIRDKGMNIEIKYAKNFGLAYAENLGNGALAK